MLNSVLWVALSPVLALQGMAVRKRALRLPEAPGPRRGTSGTGPPLSVVIVGDSSAAGVGAGDQDEALLGQLVARLSPHFTVDWHLLAQTGATTRSTLRRLEGHPPRRADVVITALGVNDVTHGVPLPVWVRRQRALLSRLDALFSPRLIYMSGLPPFQDFTILPHPLRWTLGHRAARFDAQLNRLTRQAAVPARHVPFDKPLEVNAMASDGFHPGPEIYAAWAQELASRIRSDWPS